MAEARFRVLNPVRYRRGFAAALVAALLLGTAGGVDSSPLSKMRQHWQSISQRIFGVQRKIQRTEREKKHVTEELQESQVRLERTQEQLDFSRRKLATAQAAVEQARHRLAEAKARRELQQNRFGRRIAASYRQGPVTYLDVLLGARDLSDFLDREYYVDCIAREDASVLSALRAAQRDVAREHAALVDRERSVAAVTADITREKSSLAEEANTQRRLLVKINNQLEVQEEVLEDLERESREIERALRAEEARRRRRRRTDPGYRELPSWRGFIMPIAGGRIGNRDFGMKVHPILKYSRMHSGVDIGAPSGCPIYAAAAGEVFLAGLQGGYGKRIILLHGGGLQTLYAHCSRIIVRPGQRVKQGQPIGSVGETGLASGPHLHFEVRRNGVPVDPRGYL